VLSGRKAQAARNDELVLASARAVFAADPEAPIAAVAQHAGVGISALYRRYRSKDELLQRLATDALQRSIASVELALADQREPWAVFCAFMQRSVAAGASALTMRQANSPEVESLGQRAYELTAALLQRTHAAGLRAEIEVADIALLFDMLQAVHVGDVARSVELRQRYLSLLLDALHFLSLSALPGPPPSWQELRQRYAR
jgi:AcrR family transcriptional regulator